MRVLLIEKITAFCERAGKVITINPQEIHREISGTILKEKRQTGLVPPNPEFLTKVHLSFFVGTNEKQYTLCVTDKQIKDTFITLITPKSGQVFEALQDTHGHDNSYSSPSKIDIPKGSLLIARSDSGTNRGDYFMGLYPQGTDLASVTIDGSSEVVDVYKGHTFHPYDVSHLDPRYFKLLK